MDPAAVPVYETEAAALEAELVGSGAAAAGDSRPDAPRVVVLFCHAERDEVFELLERLGARQLGRRRPASPTLAPRLRTVRRAAARSRAPTPAPVAPSLLPQRRLELARDPRTPSPPWARPASVIASR